MKGHTKIELTDVETGKTKITEEDNMVTLGLQKMLSYNPLWYTNLTRRFIIGNAIGGILLFEDKIEEDVNNYMPPAGNKNVGRGKYNLTYSGTVKEFGSFNVIESGMSDDGSVKLVWDFNTSQSNGMISCVSLTSLIGGEVGLGCSARDNTILNKELNVPLLSIHDFDSYDAVYFSYDNNYALLQDNCLKNFVCDTGSLSFTKIRMPFTDVSVFDTNIYTYGGNTAIGMTSGDFTPDTTHIIEEIEVTLPQKVLNTLEKSSNSFNYRGGLVRFSADGKIKYIFAPNAEDLPDNGIFYLCLIDANTGELEVKEITNVTGGTLELNGIRSISNTSNIGIHCASKVAVTSKYIVCTSLIDGVYKLAKININDNAETTILDYSLSYDIRYFEIYFISEEKVIFEDGGNTHILDVSTGDVSMYECLHAFDCGSNSSLGYSFQVDGNPMIVFSVNNESYSCFYQYPVPILTINNLTEPVQKTASQTMKVTYTLSEADESPDTPTYEEPSETTQT